MLPPDLAAERDRLLTKYQVSSLDEVLAAQEKILCDDRGDEDEHAINANS
ncbi:MAG: hypothetical protein V1735_06350 [Nanoarchaeota archaeon]